MISGLSLTEREVKKVNAAGRILTKVPGQMLDKFNAADDRGKSNTPPVCVH